MFIQVIRAEAQRFLGRSRCVLPVVGCLVLTVVFGFKFQFARLDVFVRLHKAVLHLMEHQARWHVFLVFCLSIGLCGMAKVLGQLVSVVERERCLDVSNASTGR